MRKPSEASADEYNVSPSYTVKGMKCLRGHEVPRGGEIMFEKSMDSDRNRIPLYERIIHPTMSQMDLEMLLESALRYALGRYTYIPGWTVGFISRFIPEVTDTCLAVMLRDVDEHLKYQGDSYPGFASDILEEWITLKDRIVKEQGRREALEGG